MLDLWNTNQMRIFAEIVKEEQEEEGEDESNAEPVRKEDVKEAHQLKENNNSLFSYKFYILKESLERMILLLL